MNPATFRKLAALGLSTDQIAGVLEVMAEDASERNAKARARWHKWKANKGSKRSQTLANASKQLAGVEDSSSKKHITEERKKEDASPAAQPKKGTRIPDDFSPDIEAAVSEGLSRPDAERHARSFCDYWRARPGKEGLKLDWQATWRVWFRKHIGEKSRATDPPKPKKTTMATMWHDEARDYGVINDPASQQDGCVVLSLPRGQDQGAGPPRRAAGT